MTLRGLLRRVALLVMLGTCVSIVAGTPADRKAQAQSDLKAIKAEIARVQERVNQDQIERDRLARDLRTAEVSVGDARGELERLRAERAAQTARRVGLTRDRAEEERALDRERGSLAAQLRSAYLIGGDEPIRLLLNQQDPARLARMLAYYSYFGRARAAQIAQIKGRLTRIAGLDEALAAEEQRLRDLESEQLAQVAELEKARANRAQVLTKLQIEARDRQVSLARLERQQSGLENLLKQLAKALEKFPVYGNGAFASLRGKLTWPVGGKLIARFGETRAGALKWNGVLVSTDRGAAVHAIFGGRIAYADWLPGLGLLTIVDHGSGYLSLYGHNERLFKSAGEQVAPGDTIAAAGDSGGGGHPQLYFEIRKGGKPIDPRPWFTAPEPR